MRYILSRRYLTTEGDASCQKDQVAGVSQGVMVIALAAKVLLSCSMDHTVW